MITADQAYQLFVNGRFVGRGPARGYQHSWPYDEIDVAAFLKKGRNIFAVRAYNPGFSNFQYLSEGLAGLLVAGRWGKTEIYSDASWKSVRAGERFQGYGADEHAAFPAGAYRSADGDRQLAGGELR